MKSNKLHIPLLLLGFIQIGSAVFFMMPDAIVEAVGFKAVPEVLDVYKYVVCSLYFSIGILYVSGAINLRSRFMALLIACVDIPLELLSYWTGFPKMGVGTWLILIFSVAIALPCALCMKDLQIYFKVRHI